MKKTKRRGSIQEENDLLDQLFSPVESCEDVYGGSSADGKASPEDSIFGE
jgi:hypothetical protein